MKFPSSFRAAALLLGLASGLPLLADDAPPPPPPAAPAPADSGQDDRQARMKKMAEQRLQMLKDKLQLTDDQVAKIKAVYQAQGDELRKLREDDSLSDDDKRGKMRDLMKSARDQVRALLTADQQKTFDTLPQQGGRRRPPPGGDAPPPPPPPPSN